jgi:hypothetical protein
MNLLVHNREKTKWTKIIPTKQRKNAWSIPRRSEDSHQISECVTFTSNLPNNAFGMFNTHIWQCRLHINCICLFGLWSPCHHDIYLPAYYV